MRGRVPRCYAAPVLRQHRIHFVGIGGIGMSGIAEVLLDLGFEVSGSDLARSELTARLETLGARISYGHDGANLPEDAEAVVLSSAVRFSNPEVARARDLGIPILPRAEMLAELMRMKTGLAVAGTHGKTTTSSMLAAILHAAGHDATAVIGGRVHSLGSNAHRGAGELLVAEADESDGTFLLLTPTIAVITNIDPEHLDHWGSLEASIDGYVEFANRVPFYGAAILGIDNSRVRGILPRLRKRHVTFGLTSDAQVAARDVMVEGFETRFDLVIDGAPVGRVTIGMPGRHVAQNALAAIAAAREIGVEPAVAIRALAAFGGIHRRFEVRGEVAGVLVIDDYGHHPEEVRATLRAAREGLGRRIVAAFQPHRYTRTRDLFEDFLGAFDDVDVLFLTDVYAAGEDPIEGADGESLARALRARGHADVRFVGPRTALAEAIAASAREGDLVLLLGAGDIIREGDRVLECLAAGAGAPLRVVR